MENIQEYIESGILEQYALGDLSAAERAAVEALAAAHPEIQEEIQHAQEALSFYAEAHAITPPLAMRERVLANVMAQIAGPIANSSLRADTDAVAQRVNPLPVAVQPAITGEATVRPFSSAPVAAPAGRSSWAIAASIALLLSLAGNAVFYARWKEARADVAALRTDQARFAATTTVAEKQRNDLRQENQVLRSDEFRAVALAGTKTAPTAHAKVLFNPATHKVYVDVRSLPVLPANKQYQLWALDKGKPVDAGMLTAATATGEGIQHMKDVTSAQTFAMTVEPVGGSASPTLSTMTVVGNI